MEVARTIQDVRRLVRQARREGRSIGFVPTMGALHEGHYSLIDAARAVCDYVVVSIFVNPTQFGPNEDYKTYPRTLEQDLQGCQAHHAALAFVPEVDEMYPPGSLTRVTVKELPDNLCGRSRPGHFDGVCTVVSKLFNIVQPDKAFFGAKDYQQAAIIRRMASDLDFPLEVVVCPTKRESDGLAMSSRNVRLAAGHRRQAVALSQALRLGMQMLTCGRAAPGEVIRKMREHIASAAPEGVIDYIQIVDSRTLADVHTFAAPVTIALAVKFGSVRLIDNVTVEKTSSR